MTTDLDGATERGPENAYPSTPGEFAARWNAMSEEARAAFVRNRVRDSEMSARCFQQDHAFEIATMEHRLTIARKVAEHWHADAVSHLNDKAVSELYSIAAHSLGLVLSALRGETDPGQLGVTPDVLA